MAKSKQQQQQSKQSAAAAGTGAAAASSSSALDGALQQNGTNLLLKLFVKPGASQSQIQSVIDGEVHVQIDAPPRDGEANDAVVKFFAKALGLSKSDVELKSGHKSRNKVLLLHVDKSTKIDELAKQILEQAKSE